MGTKTIELEVNEPDGIHRIGISFSYGDESFIAAYNRAIQETAKGIFHQTGRGILGGYHFWEFLGISPTKTEVEELFPLIHEKARQIHEDYERIFQTGGVPNEYKEQLEGELKNAEQYATEGKAANMGGCISQIKRLSQKVGRDISSKIAEIEKTGYTNGARKNLQDAKYYISKKAYDSARVSLSLSQRYSSRADDESAFYEAEELFESLKNR